VLEQLEAFSDEGLGEVMGLLALQEVQHAPEALVPPVLLLFTYQREFRLLFRTLVLGLHCVCRLLGSLAVLDSISAVRSEHGK
jgi:hypothetical protein